jgi:hypothetical protein
MRQRWHREHPWGRLDLHLPMVDVEDIEEHPGTAIVQGTPERSPELITISNQKP